MLMPIAGKKPAKTRAQVGSSATERRHSRNGRDSAGAAGKAQRARCPTDRRRARIYSGDGEKWCRRRNTLHQS